jgi:tetratricopeptide (TPR) repeat protein
MLQNNKIRVEGNGNITIQGIHNSPIHIDTSNKEDILTKLGQLEEHLLKELVQVAERERAALGALFLEQLSNFITNKNSIGGNVSGVKGNLSIGDTIIEQQTNVYNLPPKTSYPKELSDRLPTLRADKIVGRAQDLEELHQRLFNHQQVVLVNGMGGIGKTTLARVYMTHYYEAYEHLVWIGVNPENSSFELDVVNTKGLLENLKIRATGKKGDDLFQEVLRTLKAIPGQPCLMILDNATAALQDHKDYLPNQPHWHILATSRERIAHFDVKELGFLTEAEAIELFELYYKRKSLDAAFLKELVQDLEYHTLTIEILAKTAHKQRTPPQQILTALQKDLPTDAEVPHSDNKKVAKLLHYLCTMFGMSNLEDGEKHLLQQLSCLPPEWQPFGVLEDLLVQEEGQTRAVLAATLSALVDKGWVLENQELDGYKLHRIIATVVQRSIPPSVVDLDFLIKRITAKLFVDEVKDNPVDAFVWVDYGKVVLAMFEESTVEAIAVLQNNLGLILQDLGDYAGARKLLEKAMNSDEANFGEEHPTTAVRYSNLGLIIKALGDYEGARELLEKAMNSAEANFGEEHPTTAVRYSNLGMILQDLGDYAGARDLLEKAMNSAEANFGEEHPTTAGSYSNLGLILKALGDYAGARKLLEKAMNSDEANFGEEHPTTAVSYSNLGMILKALGDYAGARKLLEKAMNSAEANFGEEHPTTAVRYSNLGMILQDLENYEGAKGLIEKALLIFENQLGVEHPHTKIVQGNLDGLQQIMDANTSKDS